MPEQFAYQRGKVPFVDIQFLLLGFWIMEDEKGILDLSN